MNSMALSNETVLRPRFKIELNQSKETALQKFEGAKKIQTGFIITRSDEHIFIKIPKIDQHFWSPQLHLEIISFEDHKCTVHGFFGPNPTVWTMFMFSHFIVVLLFVGFGIWAYTNASLGNSYAIQIGAMVFLLLIWLGLYLGGRIGKVTGQFQMKNMYAFMKSILGVE
jgi:hypothetical protein